MKRIPEPELMEEEEQVRAYARADFDEPHGRFIKLLEEAFSTDEIRGCVLDLGCGPGDISLRIARAYPRCTVLGIDGSEAMISLGREIISRSGEAGRVELRRLRLPVDKPSGRDYGAIVSNSLLHHLREPEVLWHTIRECGSRGTPVFVMDLMRPASVSQAERMVEDYTAGEPEVLIRDFRASLLAAYDLGEVREQLAKAGLDALPVKEVSDRHLLVAGRLP
ncbi:MAG: class I SAM-dependent methyltransferase [Thermoleophilia bacterium]|nr:class I SAM-dependent methyltransferase [Thermoleophilia bacterium]